MRQANRDWGNRTPVLRFVPDQDRLNLIGLSLFLPALYAAWFRIKPTADDVHEPTDSTEELEVQQQRLPKTALVSEEKVQVFAR